MGNSYKDFLYTDYIPSYSDSLYHHGIKGQKWGVRRPRNEDGIIQGAGAKLAAEQKAHQKDANAYKQKIKNVQKMQRESNERYSGRGIGNAAARGITNFVGNASVKHLTKKAAKSQLKADQAKAKKDLYDWGEKANRGYAKNHDNARMVRSAEKAVDRYNASTRAAKKRYKQTINADKISEAQQKASAYQRAAGRHAAMRKTLRKQNIAVRALTAPVSGAAAAYQMYNQGKADRARARVKRLGG